MNKRIIAFPFKIIACILLCSMLLSLMPPSHAEGTASPCSIVVNTVYGKKSMSVVKKGGVWYGNINDIEDIANRRAVVNEEKGMVLFIPSNNPMYSYEKADGALAFSGGGTDASAGGRGNVTGPHLYTVDINQCLRIDGEVYVPLQEATRSIGLEFAVFEDELLAFARYTPAEVMECVNAAFSRENYVGQAKEQYPVLWSACQTFSVVTTAFASKDFGLTEAFTGAETQEKYDTVFKSVFSHDDRTTNAIINTIETSTPAGEAMKALKEAVEAGEGTYEQILKYFELDDTAFEIATAEDVTGISDETLEELIKCTKLLYNISKLDVELIQTGNEIFGNSANENISLAFSLVSALVGDYYNVAILSVFARDTALSFVEEGIGKIVGTVAPTATMLSSVVDYIAKAYPPLGDAFEITEDFQYLLVCTTIQDEVDKYYHKHADDGEEDTTKKMLDAAIIYIKTALAFEDLYNNYEPNIKRLEGILNQLLSFNEYHYAPDYTNQELIDWLNEKYPDSDEYTGYGLSVFDGTYWSMCFGQSLGFNYSAKFSADGTFSARSMGSGAYKDGTYEFHDGYLTISFDISGFGYESETEFYSSDGKEFKSVEKYGMQVGEDYYTIRALPEGDDFFDSGLEKEDPGTVTPSPVPPEQSGGNNSAGVKWSDWSEWQDTPIYADANTQVETRIVYGYYYFECPHCGAHMHGWGTVCYPWAGGCGGATPDDSGWHQIWSEISWDEANLQDWYGTGHYYTYIDGELVFQWTDNGQPKTQYRCRTKTGTGTGISTDTVLADGSYFVNLVYEEGRNGHDYLTFDLLKITGYAPSDSAIFEYAGETYTLEMEDDCVICDSSITSDSGLLTVYYDNIGKLIDLYGFDTEVQISIFDGKIFWVEKFYTP